MMLSRKVALGLAGVVAAGVIGTAGVAAATAPAPAPAASATEKAPAAEKAGKARGALKARGMHGEWVVKGKDDKPVTLVSARGTITAVSPTSVTVKAEDGFTLTLKVTADTKVRGKDVDAIGEVKAGAKGAVVGVKDGAARAVLVRK
jgi:hypothetical protein